MALQFLNDGVFSGNVTLAGAVSKLILGTLDTSISTQSDIMRFINSNSNDAGGFSFFTSPTAGGTVNALRILGTGAAAFAGNVTASNFYGLAQDLAVTSNDTFSGTYSLLWHDGADVYSSTWMTVNGSNDTLTVPTIAADLNGTINTATTGTTQTAGDNSTKIATTAYADAAAGAVPIGNYLPLAGGTLTGALTGTSATFSSNITSGSTTKTTSNVIRSLASDTVTAGFEAYGASQGTGYAYVGQSSSHGGGMFYNGDGTPAFATGETADRVSFYRRINSANTVVFEYPYNSSTVTFKGPIVVGGTITGQNIYGNQFVDAQDNAYYANPAMTSVMKGASFDGDVTVTTQAVGDDSTLVATTEYADRAAANVPIGNYVTLATAQTITGAKTINTLKIGSTNKIQFANNDFIRYDDANGVGRFHFDSDGGTNNASVQAATFVGALSGNATSATTAADSNLLDGINSTQFLRSDVDDSFSGAIVSSNRANGIFGTYDSNKTDSIWSMGTAYKNNVNGSNFGNLYGLAYKHTNNTTGGTMAGGHQMVWCSNGTGKSAIGDNLWTSGNVIATGTVTGSNLSGTNTGDQDLSGYLPLAGGAMTGNIAMGNKQITGIDELQFNSGVTIETSGADNYLDVVYSSTGAGGIRLWDGDSTLQGYLFGDGGATSSFGLLHGGGNWAVRCLENSYVELTHNSVAKLTTNTSGVTVSGTLTANIVGNSTSQTRSKLAVWSGNTYSIGMMSGFGYGGLGGNTTGTDYAMSFQMSNSTNRGWWWGDTSHTNLQGAMSLTTTGKAVIATSLSIGYGESTRTAATQALEVNGTVVANAIKLKSGGTEYLNTSTYSSSAFIYGYASGSTIYFGQPATWTQNIRVAGNISGVSYTTASDKRLKDNIKPIGTKHLNINWKNFELKSEPGIKRTGVIAQELEESHPEFVKTDEKGFKSVAYTELLIAKIAELELRINKLEKQ